MYLVVNNGPCQRIPYNPSFTPTTEILQQYSGVFARVERFGTGFDQLTFRVEQEKLFVHSQAEQAEFLCTAISDTRFAWRQGQIDFLLNEDGTVTKLLVAATELYEHMARARTTMAISHTTSERTPLGKVLWRPPQFIARSMGYLSRNELRRGRDTSGPYNRRI